MDPSLKTTKLMVKHSNNSLMTEMLMNDVHSYLVDKPVESNRVSWLLDAKAYNLSSGHASGPYHWSVHAKSEQSVQRHKEEKIMYICLPKFVHIHLTIVA